MSKKIPILDFKLISAHTIGDMMETEGWRHADVRIRVKLNGRYFVGDLEMSE